MYNLTVKQLIEMLNAYPQDAKVYVQWEMFATSPIQDIQYDPETNEVVIGHDN